MKICNNADDASNYPRNVGWIKPFPIPHRCSRCECWYFGYNERMFKYRKWYHGCMIGGAPAGPVSKYHCVVCADETPES